MIKVVLTNICLFLTILHKITFQSHVKLILHMLSLKLCFKLILQRFPFQLIFIQRWLTFQSHSKFCTELHFKLILHRITFLLNFKLISHRIKFQLHFMLILHGITLQLDGNQFKAFPAHNSDIFSNLYLKVRLQFNWTNYSVLLYILDHSVICM